LRLAIEVGAASLLHLRHPDITTVYLWQVDQDLVAGDAEV
jgi:hypothetical protein